MTYSRGLLIPKIKNDVVVTKSSDPDELPIQCCGLVAQQYAVYDYAVLRFAIQIAVDIRCIIRNAIVRIIDVEIGAIEIGVRIVVLLQLVRRIILPVLRVIDRQQRFVMEEMIEQAVVREQVGLKTTAVFIDDTFTDGTTQDLANRRIVLNAAAVVEAVGMAMKFIG